MKLMSDRDLIGLHTFLSLMGFIKFCLCMRMCVYFCTFLPMHMQELVVETAGKFTLRITERVITDFGTHKMSDR